MLTSGSVPSRGWRFDLAQAQPPCRFNLAHAQPPCREARALAVTREHANPVPGAAPVDVSDGDLETDEALGEWPAAQGLESASGAGSGGAASCQAKVTHGSGKPRGEHAVAKATAGEVKDRQGVEDRRARDGEEGKDEVMDEVLLLATKAAGRLSAGSPDDVRCQACLELAGLGRQAKSFFLEVLECLKEDGQSDAVKIAAAEAVVALGEDNPAEATLALAAQLGSAEPTLRRVAVLGLGQLKGGDALAPELASLLHDRDLQVRDAVLVTLSVMLRAGAETTPVIARAVATRLREPLLRSSAAAVLGLLGSDGAEWAGELLLYLSDSDVRVREAVVESLLAFREHLDEAILDELQERGMRDHGLGAQAAKVALSRLEESEAGIIIVD